MIDETHVCRVFLYDAGKWPLSFIFEFLNRHSPHFAKDVVLINEGLHHGTDDNSTLPTHLNAFRRYRAAVQRTGSWTMPRMIWVDTLAQHFSTPDGTYCRIPEGALVNDTCRAIPLSAFGEDESGPHNALAAPFVRGISDLHLEPDAPAVSHRSSAMAFAEGTTPQKRDCTHYCIPGAPQLWIFEVFRLLSRHEFLKMV